ncbi:divalent metal ion transporter SMF2 [Sugiyamaella lignohabitans]|uniref:Divalent metal ion transporter SMF2 n=1 Tax=Sugiyamaella lignohabitans TaxID=796027 RepID=A0A161HFA9_9ASCO|nr:divalent metal ion transporter SMF2 [Sugiyamaella lignohabitans]ANB14180.1 divalent metal ion transporter SMF2 [Sugiyamaella lignohabitans]
MNCPTRDTEPAGRIGHNQNPPLFNNDTNTRRSFDKDQDRTCGGNDMNLDSTQDAGGGGPDFTLLQKRDGDLTNDGIAHGSGGVVNGDGSDATRRDVNDSLNTTTTSTTLSAAISSGSSTGSSGDFSTGSSTAPSTSLTKTSTHSVKGSTTASIAGSTNSINGSTDSINSSIDSSTANSTTSISGSTTPLTSNHATSSTTTKLFASSYPTDSRSVSSVRYTTSAGAVRNATTEPTTTVHGTPNSSLVTPAIVAAAPRSGSDDSETLASPASLASSSRLLESAPILYTSLDPPANYRPDAPDDPNPKYLSLNRGLVLAKGPDSGLLQSALSNTPQNIVDNNSVAVKKVRFNTKPPEEFSHSFDFDTSQDDGEYGNESIDEDEDDFDSTDLDPRASQYSANIPLLQQIDNIRRLREQGQVDTNSISNLNSQFGSRSKPRTLHSTHTVTSDMTPSTSADTPSPASRRRNSYLKPSAPISSYGTSTTEQLDPPGGPSLSDPNRNTTMPGGPDLGTTAESNIDRRGSSGTANSTGSGRSYSPSSSSILNSSMSFKEKIDYIITHSRKVAFKYARFIGPGIMVSVAYLDPGNYSTAVTAGAMYQYKHLFVILLSNVFAVFLQILCVKLGSVTGLDLAQNCREHLPRWLCIAIYILAEIAIIATDLAEVVGTAIALNILFNIPLAIGVLLTVLDVLIVLMAYRPNGPVKFVRYFEYLVSVLVFVVVLCFAVELMSIGPIGLGTVLKGFLPSPELVESDGLYMSCGILGATVMPHSLYLGSGLVQPRLREFDTKHGYFSDDSSSGTTPNIIQDIEDEIEEVLHASSASIYSSNSSWEASRYRPSIHAIKYAMNFSIAELVMSLFTVAIFVNSAILIVAAATLAHSPEAEDADLFSIYDMLWKYLGHFAAVIFALALLFSGQSAGIVCTLAGQMVSEGFLHWSFQPWIRRLITRAIAIAPCLLVALFVGRKGLADVLNASQVVLSLLLPFVSAPLLYFTQSKKIMSVRITDRTPVTTSGSDGYTAVETDETTVGTNSPAVAYLDMSNSKLTNGIAIFIFVFVSSLNAFLILSMALGADVKM